MALRIVLKLSVRSIRGNILLHLDRSASTFKKTATLIKVIAIKKYNALSVIAILAYFNFATFTNTKKLRRVFTI